MPKPPDAKSQAAIKKREVISAATKAKPKTEDVATAQALHGRKSADRA